VLSLIVSAPTCLDPDPDIYEALQAVVGGIRRGGWTFWKEWFTTSGLLSSAFASCKDEMDAVMEHQEEMFHATQPPGEGFAVFLELWNERRIALNYEAVLQPTLITCGTSDAFFLANAEWMRSHVPRSEFTWLAETGHYPHVECPGEFARACTDFLRRQVNPAKDDADAGQPRRSGCCSLRCGSGA